MGGGRKINPAVAWSAASAAVATVLGAPPPVTAGVMRGGRRSDAAETWRRKVAIYTAAISLGAGVRPLMRHMGVGHSAANEVVRDMEDLRDGPAIDDLLELLKREAERLVAADDRKAA